MLGFETKPESMFNLDCKHYNSVCRKSNISDFIVKRLCVAARSDRLESVKEEVSLRTRGRLSCLRPSEEKRILSYAKHFGHESTLGLKNPSHRYDFLKSGDMWLEEKRITDGAEGLWRIHDGLYDFTNFLQKHPGGRFWLDVTKGIDITEAFESHHISAKPESLLQNYYVRKANTPRSSPYTFQDNGFYKTLKKNVRNEIKHTSNTNQITNMTTDMLLVGTFVFALLSNAFWSYTLAMLSGISFGFTLVAAHNYAHQRDNFRMYYSDICMMQTREWRILHILSHHLFTNTVLDAQIYFSEPFVLFYPQKKPFFMQYGSWIYTPLVLWPNLLHVGLLLRISQWVVFGRTQQLSITDFLPLTLPACMYIIGGQTLLATFTMWILIECIGSFTFSFLGYTTGHFHPEIFIDGDRPRSQIDRDWGIMQIDSVSDRREIVGNTFLVLISFGDHALHHLFPTLDHGNLKQLYPIVQKTMKEFNADIWMTTHPNMLAGYFRQLARDKPNPNYPNSVQRNRKAS